jgi:hypothetical protein
MEIVNGCPDVNIKDKIVDTEQRVTAGGNNE